MSRQYKRRPAAQRRMEYKRLERITKHEVEQWEQIAMNQAEQRRHEDEHDARRTLDLIERLIDAKLKNDPAHLDTVREALVAELLAK